MYFGLFLRPSLQNYDIFSDSFNLTVVSHIRINKYLLMKIFSPTLLFVLKYLPIGTEVEVNKWFNVKTDN